MSKSVNLPVPEYKALTELAREWGITSHQILTYGATGKLVVYVVAGGWNGTQGEYIEENYSVVPEKIGPVWELLRVSSYTLRKIQVEGKSECDLFELDNGDYVRLNKTVILVPEILCVTASEQQRFESIAGGKLSTIPDYSTPLMEAMYAAIEEFWVGFDRTRPPSKETVINWLMNKKRTSQTGASAIDKIIRHTSRKKGGIIPTKSNN